MVFSSTVFLFLFLPVILGLYFLTPDRFKNHLLLACSLFFYAWGEKAFILVMLTSIAVNYACAVFVGLFLERRPLAKAVLIFAIAANLSLLIAFKYANFIVANLNPVLASIGLASIHLDPVHLPIGISFFTFQALSYIVDVYRRCVPAERNPIRVALYIALFPQLIAGPIVRYTEVAREIASRFVGMSDFAAGIRRFIIGLGKKMLIANTLAVPADAIFALSADQLTLGLAWLGAASYTLQLYFDFSGYSDMAIGLGRMFGFRFGENFNYPYVARSITEFWRRWHISLSTWFRDYLYIPLGGNRGSAARTYFNLVLVFFLCGLWHGASWNFIVWGLFHGVLLIFERLGACRLLSTAWAPLSHCYLLLSVVIGWVVFRAPTLSDSISYLAAMFGQASGNGTEYYAAMYLNAEIWLTLIIGAAGAAPVFPNLGRAVAKISETLTAAPPVLRHAIGVASVSFYASVLGLSALSLASGTHNPFIYFRF